MKLEEKIINLIEKDTQTMASWILEQKDVPNEVKETAIRWKIPKHLKKVRP